MEATDAAKYPTMQWYRDAPQQLLIPLSKISVVEKLQSRSVSWKILLKVIFSSYFNIFLGQVFGQGRRDWDRRRSRLSQAWTWKALPFLVSPQSPRQWLSSRGSSSIHVCVAPLFSGVCSRRCSLPTPGFLVSTFAASRVIVGFPLALCVPTGQCVLISRAPPTQPRA